MEDLHLTRELLWAVFRGELPAQLIAQIGWEHLRNLCPVCREEIDAFTREKQRTTTFDYTRAFELLPAIIEEHMPELTRQEGQAARDFRELLKLPREERGGRVKRARGRFRSASLVRLLIDESRRRVHADPDESYHLAELARLVTHSAPRMPGVFDLVALATAEMANAKRASGNLRHAEEHFGHARYLITHQGVTDPEVLARIDDLEGSLRKDQRLFTAAEQLLTRAAMLYRLSGAKAEVARVLLKLGSMHFHHGQLDRAISTVRSALKKITRADEPRLYLCARFNLARYLTEAGEYHKADSLLTADEDLYRDFPEAWTQLRLIWLRGKIAAGMGKSEEAEQAFITARAGFIAQGIGYDAAMVSVEDLAPLYLREGRTGDVKRLAEEMLPIFQSQDVHREALAALMLFQEAARSEELTIAMARDFAAYLKAARTDPSLRFKAPS